jgi:eukaryotic-like serine/threonine-protein kinase
MATDADRDSGEWDDEAPTRITHPFAPGAMFGERFQIVRELAVGGMGSVYHAVDLSTEQAVALKVMKRERTPDQEALQRFRREAEILASMDHPGIVRIRDFGHVADGRPWLAMELLEGETLLDRVQREGPQDPHRLLAIMTATCDALEAAHARGVVHRDLKPENIFLPSGGETRVKVLDFGLSQLAGAAKLTRTGAILGTPRYMAPEQIKSARSADARVDVYAMGIIAYEGLAGTSPFTASDHGQLLGAILTGRRRPLTEVRPELPVALEEALSRALDPDPDQRFATAGDLSRALTSAVGSPRPASYGSSFADEDVDPPTLVQRLSSPPQFSAPAPADSVARPPERSRPAAAVAVGLAAGLALVAAAWAAVQVFGP